MRQSLSVTLPLAAPRWANRCSREPWSRRSHTRLKAKTEIVPGRATIIRSGGPDPSKQDECFQYFELCTGRENSL